MSLGAAFKKIPVVDIAPLIAYGPDISKRAVQQCILECHRNCRDVGFISIVNHGFSKELQKDALYKSRQFFALPLEEKMQIHISNFKDGKRGYQRLGDNITQMQKDAHEGLDMFRSTDNPEHWPLNTPDQWPKRPSDYKEIMEEYVAQMLKLGDSLMQAIALGLRLPYDFFQPFMDKSFWIMRAIHYPIQSLKTTSNSTKNPILHPRHSKEDQELKEYPWGIGCGEHRDYGCLTMISHDEIYGSECLQVKNCQNEWITIDNNNEYEKDGILINIGDMLHYWSNALYQSTPHRVLNPKPKDIHIPDKLYQNTGRISIPFFYEPNWECTVEPINFHSPEKLSSYTLKYLPWEDIDREWLKSKDPSSSNKISSEQIKNLHMGNIPFLYNGPVKYGDHLKSKLLNNFYDR